MIILLFHLLRLFLFLFGSHRQLALENLALRQQLAVYKRTVIRPPLSRRDRLFWAGWPASGPGGRSIGGIKAQLTDPPFSAPPPPPPRRRSPPPGTEAGAKEKHNIWDPAGMPLTSVCA